MSAWIIAAVAFVLGFLLHQLYRQMEVKKKIGLKKDEAEIIIENARKEAEKVRIQGELKAKEIVEKRTSEIEFEVREKQKELFKAEKGSRNVKRYWTRSTRQSRKGNPKSHGKSAISSPKTRRFPTNRRSSTP